MTLTNLLRTCQRGAATVEFAIAVPVLVVMLYGIFQVGLIFQANAGMQHALGEGARLATLCTPSGSTCTSPTDAAIVAKMTAKESARTSEASARRLPSIRDRPRARFAGT